jgi:hypothetical protein
LTNPAVPTNQAADRLEPTVRKTDSTQPDQNDARQSSINTAPATAAQPSPTVKFTDPTATRKVPAATAKAAPPASPPAPPSITDDNDKDNNKANRPKTPDDNEDNKGKKGDNSKKVSPHPTNTATQESSGARNPASPPKPTATEVSQD